MNKARIIIAGRVQGVFFRDNTRREAMLRGLNGWVKNRQDGQVEALFEGNKEIIEDMIKWCHQGPTFSRVDNVAVVWETGNKKYSSFSIRR